LILAGQKKNFLSGGRSHADRRQSRDNRQRFHVTLSTTKLRRPRYSKAWVARLASADGLSRIGYGILPDGRRETVAAVQTRVGKLDN
jgi:hypothetical protein